MIHAHANHGNFVPRGGQPLTNVYTSPALYQTVSFDSKLISFPDTMASANSLLGEAFIMQHVCMLGDSQSKKQTFSCDYYIVAYLPPLNKTHPPSPPLWPHNGSKDQYSASKIAVELLQSDSTPAICWHCPADPPPPTHIPSLLSCCKGQVNHVVIIWHLPLTYLLPSMVSSQQGILKYTLHSACMCSIELCTCEFASLNNSNSLINMTSQFFFPFDSLVCII